jgi:hypothetical protein
VRCRHTYSHAHDGSRDVNSAAKHFWASRLTTYMITYICRYGLWTAICAQRHSTSTVRHFVLHKLLILWIPGYSMARHYYYPTLVIVQMYGMMVVVHIWINFTLQKRAARVITGSCYDIRSKGDLCSFRMGTNWKHPKEKGNKHDVQIINKTTTRI